jgi:hypothetical protein
MLTFFFYSSKDQTTGALGLVFGFKYLPFDFESLTRSVRRLNNMRHRFFDSRQIPVDRRYNSRGQRKVMATSSMEIVPNPWPKHVALQLPLAAVDNP